MLYSFFISAWRNLIKHRLFSVINMIGLSIGIASALLILIYLRTELSFDSDIPEKQRTFRLYQDEADGANVNLVPGLFPLLSENIAGIDAMARILPAYGIVFDPMQRFDPVYVGQENDIFYADADFPEIIGVNGIAGNIDLSNPHSAIISESTARAWFGTTEAAPGNIFHLEDQFDQLQYQVVGVFEDIRQETHIRPEILLSYHALIPTRFGWDDLDGFGWGSFFYYLRLAPGHSPQQFEAMIEDYAQQFFDEGTDPPLFRLQPVTDVHLDQRFSYDIASRINPDTLLIMSGLGLFILVIAWLNYVNMATARSIGRDREVGIRKTVGATRPQLIIQFLLESLVLNFFGVMLAIVITDICLPVFMELNGLEAPDRYWSESWFWGITGGIFILGTIASGFYPAFLMSGFQVGRMMKKGQAASNGRGRLRQALVSVQFMLSMILLSGAAAVYSQMEFISDQHASLSIEHKIAIEGPRIFADSSSGDRVDHFRERLTQDPRITGISLTSALPGLGFNYGNGGVKPLSKPEMEPITCEVWYGDHQFQPLYQIPLKAGRNFDPAIDHDDPVILLNESAARALGFHDISTIVGEQIEVEGIHRVVGVVADYHHESLRTSISPSVYLFRQNFGIWYTLEVAGQHSEAMLPFLDSLYRHSFPGNPVRMFFFEELYEKLYAEEQDFGTTAGIFAGLAMVIACLGLIGLAVFSAKKRAREIGIRKVMGAKVRDLVLFLSKELLLVVAIAVVIAVPMSWYIIHTWLQQFAYQFSIGPWFFLFPGLGLVLVAWLSVSWQTILTASADPVKSLRQE